jgi:D-lactate dehydrogenase (cytochrome)
VTGGGIDWLMPYCIVSAMADTTKRGGLETLSSFFKSRFETGEALRRQHANTLSLIENQPPDAVVFVESTSEVAFIAKTANECGIPLIAFGAGTSLEGHVNAPHGGLSIDMSRMNKVARVSQSDLDCTVEAGVTQSQLNGYLRDTGLFFSVDPGAGHATLGGMASTRASGTNTVRYGTMSDNVLSLTAVLAGGRIVETGTRARKSAAGYDLTRLLIGSEGTLGIITELNLRLHPVPEAIGVAIAAFPTVEAACTAALETTLINAGIARVELADALTIDAVNRYAKLSLSVMPTLFVEWHTPAASAQASATAVQDTLMECGAVSFESALESEHRNQLWTARHNAFWAIRNAWPGKTPVVTDVCVPVSRLAECIALTQGDIKECGLIAPIVGHVGDGNFHSVPMIDASNSSDVAKVHGFLERLSARAISMDGTCSGEHGIGQGKMAALANQAGCAVDVMRLIKHALDPKGILNPGKIF